VETREYFPAVETLLISSKRVRQTFKIQIMRPAQRRGTTAKFPVVYATDGNSTFDALKGISYSLQSSERSVRFILVGIGYPGDCPDAGTILRGRDMTFPAYPQLSMTPPPVEGVLEADEGSKNFHGAEDFQRFIHEELIPLIDEKYEAIPGDRTYFGHSLGGGFGLFTLFTRSDLFRNYIISSPGLIFHGESSAGAQYDNYDFVLREARNFIVSKGSLHDVSLYMSVGGEEEFETDLVQWQLTSSFYRMARLMKAAAIPGLRLTTELISGETHLTVWPISFMHGIRIALCEA
jgi:uncharacterized protein